MCVLNVVCMCCDLAASISYCSVSSNLAIYRDSLLCLLKKQMASRGMSLKQRPALDVWPLQRLRGGTRTKARFKNARLRAGVNTVLHSTCCGVEMFTNPRTQVFLLATSYAVIIH